MTNEEKRNIYNNIQNLYNMDFTTWQEVLAMMYNLVADIEQKFEAFEQKFEIMVGKEVTEAIKKLYESGKLAEIINQEVFGDLNNKIDKIKAEILMTLTDEIGKIDKEIEVINGQLDNITQQATKFNNPTRAWSKSKKLNVYEAWTFTNGFYDKETDEICLAYNSKKYHTSNTGKVLFRKKKDVGEFNEPVEICDGYKCHACGINALGEYMAICQDITGEHGFDGGMCYSFKSIDKGETWTNVGKLNVTNVIINEVEPITGMTLMRDGSLFCFVRTYENKSYILKSTDNGSSWIASDIVLPATNILLEGNFIELSDGTISCVVRGVLSGDNFTKHKPTYLINSFDKGSTWESKIELNIEASYNNVALLYHEDIKAVEMLYASRLKENGNDNGSLYQAIAKEEDFKQGKITHQTKIALGGIEGDFGYCELVKSKNNVVNAFFYIDEYDTSGACIMEMAGTRNGELKTIQYDNPVIILPTNAINGNTLPSYFKNLILGESATIKCRVFANTEGLPTNAKGIIYTDCFSYINGYNRQRFFPALSQQIYERRDFENSDGWTEWVDVTPINEKIEMDTTLIINTPFTRYSFLKSPITLFNSSSDTIESQITIDTKSLFNNEWYNTYADGLKIEVLYKNIEGNTETQAISFNDNNFNTAYQRRIVCQHNFEQNYYIDTWISSSTKELKVKIDKPAKVQTLIIRAVGILFKQN